MLDLLIIVEKELISVHLFYMCIKLKPITSIRHHDAEGEGLYGFSDKTWWAS